MKNWFELRLWSLTDLDAIAIIDADSIVLGDLTHVFKLPTDFAWAPDAGPGVDYEEGTAAHYQNSIARIQFMREQRCLPPDTLYFCYPG